MNLKLSEKEASKYSVANAILSAAGGPKANCFEKEVSDQISRDIGRPAREANALFLPTRLRPQMAGLDTRTSAAGDYLVGGTVELVEALRSQTRCVQLGAQLLTGLRGNALFALEDATTAAHWVQENPGVDVSEDDPSFACRNAAPHALQGTTSFSKQLLGQNSVDVENFIRRSLMKSHAIALDAAAINGSGQQNEPVGLLKQSGLNIVAIGADGGAATYAKICDLEAAIANSNADEPTVGFLTNPAQRNKLRQVYKGGGSEPVWSDEGGPLGYRGVVSTSVPSDLTKGSGQNLSAIIAGGFEHMLLCEFGVLEVIVDPYKLKRQAMLEITSFSFYDIVIKHSGAFACILDAA